MSLGKDEEAAEAEADGSREQKNTNPTVGNKQLPPKNRMTGKRQNTPDINLLQCYNEHKPNTLREKAMCESLACENAGV